MIWATVISLSCFCWLYRASPSLAAKNKSVWLQYWWYVMSTFRVLSCVVGRGCLLWPVHSLGKTLLAFALLHSILQGQICPLLQIFIDSLLFHSSPLWWKGVLECLVNLHRTIQLQLFSITGWGIDLDYCDIEWFALEMNRDNWFCCFWNCIQVLHFRLFCWLWWLRHFF